MLRLLFNKNLVLIALISYSCTEPCIVRPNEAHRESIKSINHDNSPREDLRKYTGKLDMVEGKEFSDKNILALNTWIDSLPKKGNDFKFIHIQHFSCKNTINEDEEYKQTVHKRIDQYEKLVSQINNDKNSYPISLILKSYHPCEKEYKNDYLKLSVQELKKSYKKPITPHGYMIETVFEKDLVTDTITKVSVILDSLTTYVLSHKSDVRD